MIYAFPRKSLAARDPHHALIDPTRISFAINLDDFNRSQRDNGSERPKNLRARLAAVSFVIIPTELI